MNASNGNVKGKGIFKGKSVWILLYAIYLALILISVQAFLAQDSIDDIRKGMDEKYDYYLTFDKDGSQSHYDVTRYNTSEQGLITLTYWTQDNYLEVKKVENIKTLKIDVISMFEDESSKVFKKKHTILPNLYKDYWLDAGDGIFTVEFDIDTKEELKELVFTKFPKPKSVTVNNQEWWKTDLHYSTSKGEITISKIPTGKTTVVLYFKLANEMPVPDFTMDPTQFAGVNENIDFDASSSSDSDGIVVSWVWDFGDSTSDSGKQVTHSYTKPGDYKVRLTVRDDAEPFGEDWKEKTIIVAYGAEDDFDKDGLRDIWEWEYFGTLNETGNNDFDSDGASNKEEHDERTDPTNPASKPEPDEKEKGKEKEADSSMDLILGAIVAIIIIVVLLVLMFVMKSKKSREEKERDSEAITKMETKIERAQKLGLPTGELERLLAEAKEGKPLEVTPIKEKKGPAITKTRPKGKGKGRNRR